MFNIHRFLFEATCHLCSSLQAETSLQNFYSFVRQTIPINELRLSRSFAHSETIMRFATVTANTIDCSQRSLHLNAAQIKLVDELDVNNPDKYKERMVVYENDELLIYLQTFSNITPPFYFLRLVRDGEIVGSAIFCSEKAFTEDQLNLLRALESPLCMVLINMIQYGELHTLKEKLQVENQELQKKLEGYTNLEIIGQDKGLAQVVKKVQMVAPVDAPVLITGETGTGKEVIANAIHKLSPRKNMPFVGVNCGALSPTLLDSELFGYAKGAFTGALSSHKGRFERAEGGTLFLDEIGELPLEAQARFLRVLENKEVEKVGGTTPIKVNIRVVAATHRDLAAMVSAGTFREDLYYRLRVISIEMPPLRERKQDIPELVHFLLRRSALRYGMAAPHIPMEEMEKMLHHDWPGNVRELQNVLEEALICCDGKSLHISLGSRPSVQTRYDGQPLTDLDAVLRAYFTRCLQACHGKVDGPSGAARLANLTPSTFRFRCKKLGIVPRRMG